MALLTELLTELIPLFLIAAVLTGGSIHYKCRYLLETELERDLSKRAVKEQHRAHTNEIFGERIAVLRGISDSLAMRWQREMVTPALPQLQELLKVHDSCMMILPLVIGFLLGGQQFPVLLYGGVALLLLLTGIRLWLAFR